MSLSIETFARLTQGGSPFPPSAGVCPAERRRQGRVALGQRGQVRPAGGRAWQTVMIRDLSIVGLQADARMVKGQPLMLRLTGPSGVTAELPCVVRWCEPGGFLHAGFHIGAVFVEPPPPQGPGPTKPAWLADMLLERRLRQAMNDAT
jgi:hypothetical protein